MVILWGGRYAAEKLQIATTRTFYDPDALAAVEWQAMARTPSPKRRLKLTDALYSNFCDTMTTEGVSIALPEDRLGLQ